LLLYHHSPQNYDTITHMSQLTDLATDARQTPQWREYLEKIGWKIREIDRRFLAIRHVPYLNHSIIKMTHPDMPVPFEKIDKIAQEQKALFILIEPHIRGYSEKEFFGSRVSKIKNASCLFCLTSDRYLSP
jgi:hypothetical protein